MSILESFNISMTLTLSGNPVSENLTVYGDDKLAAIRIPKSRLRSLMIEVNVVHISPSGPFDDGIAALRSITIFLNNCT